jgi:hypothetical protein
MGDGVRNVVQAMKYDIVVRNGLMNYNNRREGVKKARRVLRVLRGMWNKYPFAGYYSDGGEYEKTLIKTRKPCSCMMCGNYRKWQGVTRKEKLADLMWSETE